MRSSPSMDKVLLLRRGRPQSSYTIDTPSWGEKSRFHSFRNNLCIGNRNVTFALFGFLGAILAVAGALAYVHSGGPRSLRAPRERLRRRHHPIRFDRRGARRPGQPAVVAFSAQAGRCALPDHQEAFHTEAPPSCPYGPTLAETDT
ncbi:hypothetical protein MRX96_040834 [Rhipicephalus microplus]